MGTTVSWGKLAYVFINFEITFPGLTFSGLKMIKTAFCGALLQNLEYTGVITSVRKRNYYFFVCSNFF